MLAMNLHQPNLSREMAKTRILSGFPRNKRATCFFATSGDSSQPTKKIFKKNSIRDWMQTIDISTSTRNHMELPKKSTWACYGIFLELFAEN